MERTHSDERTITSGSSNTNQRSLTCTDITLTPEEYLNIRENDVIGAYVSRSSISVVGTFETAVVGAGVHEDTRSALASLLLSNSIEIGELTSLNNTIGLYLYVDISKFTNFL